MQLTKDWIKIGELNNWLGSLLKDWIYIYKIFK